jgi:DNA-binding PadR family transcriptional regulator
MPVRLKSQYKHGRHQKENVSSTSNNFDLKQFAQDLSGFIRDRASNLGAARTAGKPDQQQIELAVLTALDSGSKNAGQIHQALTLSSAGSWAPTESQIHQALGRLAETGKVSSSTKKDRKTFAITEDGRAALSTAAEAMVNNPTQDEKPSGNSMNWMSCDPSFYKSASKLGPVLMDIAQTGTAPQQQRAAELLEQTRYQLHVILTEK